MTPGHLADGSDAPENTDTARLDWWARHPEKVKNLKSGTYATAVKMWQPGLRAAIDAAMETMRQELRAKGLTPEW